MIVALQDNLAHFHLVEAFERARNERALPYDLRWEGAISDGEAPEVRVVVPGSHSLNAEYISALHDRYANLKHIALPMTGDDGLDKNACAAHGITFSRVRGYSTDEVAEYTETLALALRHEIVPKALAMRNGYWCDKPTVEMKGACVGILGLGAIGLASAARFASRGCTVIGWSRTPKEHFAKLGGHQVDLDEVFGEAEILLVHVPLVRGPGGTEKIVSAARIGRMRKCDFVNVARADLVDADALLAAVLAGRLHGVALDVFHPEPPFGSSTAWAELCALDPQDHNTLCAPHMGFKKSGALRRLVDGVLGNISGLELPE